MLSREDLLDRRVLLSDEIRSRYTMSKILKNEPCWYWIQLEYKTRQFSVLFPNWIMKLTTYNEQVHLVEAPSGKVIVYVVFLDYADKLCRKDEKKFWKTYNDCIVRDYIDLNKAPSYNGETLTGDVLKYLYGMASTSKKIWNEMEANNKAVVVSEPKKKDTLIKPPPPKTPIKEQITQRTQERDKAYQESKQQQNKEDTLETQEGKLKKLITTDRVGEVFDLIMNKIGDGIQIFDEKLNVVASAKTKEEAMTKLIKIMEDDITNKTQKAHKIGNNFSMIELRKSKTNMPMLYSSFISLINGTDLKSEKGKQRYYKIKEMYEQGFNEEDLKKLAQETLEDKLKLNYTGDVSARQVKSKTYTPSQLKQIRAFAKKNYK